MEFKMKNLLKSVGAAVLAFIAINAFTLNAQIYGEFNNVTIVQESYTPLPIGATAINWFDFSLPPNPPGPLTADLDDGYARVNIGFPFEYNGEIYNQVYICINGFITFERPLNLRQNVPTGLFQDFPNSYATNVVAPYWGDHRYRFGQQAAGYMNSTILYQEGNAANGFVFTVEWRNLQLNKNIEDLPSSVGSFQVKLYNSDDAFSAQGDIEFCYGLVGGNPNTADTRVITRNASVGIKGDFSDFMNGLHPNSGVAARTQTTLSNQWQPSGGTDRRIRFIAEKSFKIDEWWGDGDVDFSKAPGNRHANLPQNRFVTINDARLVMRSVVTRVPLDSVRRKAAYHADVNHNGRYYYNDVDGKRYDIPWRSMNYADNLPPGISTIKKVFYQADEADASMILTYLSARVPNLPWIYDTIVNYGKKLPEIERANNLKIFDIKDNGNGTQTLAVGINGWINGNVSAKFDVNSTITDAFRNEDITPNALLMFENDRLVFAASGEFTTNDILFYVTVNKVQELMLNEVRFNGANVGYIASAETKENTTVNTISASPNPFSTETTFRVNIEAAGNYSLLIYDMLGNEVKSAVNNFFNAGEFNYVWDGRDNAGNLVNEGMYVYKLVGANEIYTNKVMIAR